jgi:hypothetical protein
VPERKGMAKLMGFATVVLRSLVPSLMSPTRQLGKVLTELATGEIGEGKPLEGNGVDGEGRTVSNAGFRRLAGL